jgi:hypothetical protein
MLFTALLCLFLHGYLENFALIHVKPEMVFVSICKHIVLLRVRYLIRVRDLHTSNLNLAPESSD